MNCRMRNTFFRNRECKRSGQCGSAEPRHVGERGAKGTPLDIGFRETPYLFLTLLIHTPDTPNTINPQTSDPTGLAPVARGFLHYLSFTLNSPLSSAKT